MVLLHYYNPPQWQHHFYVDDQGAFHRQDFGVLILDMDDRRPETLDHQRFQQTDGSGHKILCGQGFSFYIHCVQCPDVNNAKLYKFKLIVHSRDC
jgi:hypothetical protein